MTSIDKTRKLVTMIHVFTVAPENQQLLLDILVRATENVLKFQPGYISMNIHKSLDGMRVTNYEQWASLEALEAGTLKNLALAPYIAETSKISKAEMHLYQVEYTDQAASARQIDMKARQQ